MTDNAKALADHIRSDLTYITGLADHMEAGGDVSKKNIGDLIAMVRWNAEHHLECRDTIEIQGREIERLSAVIEKICYVPMRNGYPPRMLRPAFGSRMWWVLCPRSPWRQP